MPRFLLVLLLTSSAFATTIELLPPIGFGNEAVGLIMDRHDVLSVTFDGVPALYPSYYSGCCTWVGAPEHAPGEVEVLVTFRNGDTATATFRYTTLDEWERVLVPLDILGPLKGAYGSEWMARTYVTALDRTLYLRGDWCDEGGRYGIACPPTFARRVLPGSTEILTQIPAANAPGPGAFFYFFREARDSIALQSSLRDQSRDADTLGTEQPIVPVSSFKQRTVLLSVPADPRFRVLLRVYGSSSDGTAARVKIGRQVPIETFFDETIELRGVVETSPKFHTTPAFAQIPLDGLPQLAGNGPLRIEVTSVNGDPLWAFASITNNTTQQVTLVTPQL